MAEEPMKCPEKSNMETFLKADEVKGLKSIYVRGDQCCTDTATLKWTRHVDT